MKVIALKVGFFGGQLRHEGEEFEVKTKAELGTWMRPIREKRTPSPVAKAKAANLEIPGMD